MYNIQIELYKIDKKINSTKRPVWQNDSDVNRRINVEFIEPLDIYEPILKLVDYDGSCDCDINTTDDIAQFNYCYIPDSNVNRYYWITNWTREYGIWIAHCSLDVLATWKDEILETTQYVTRCSSKHYWNNEIIDDTYKPIYNCYREVLKPFGLGVNVDLDYKFDYDGSEGANPRNLCIAIGLRAVYSDVEHQNQVNLSSTGVYATSILEANTWQKLASVVSTATGNGITSYVNKFYILPFSPHNFFPVGNSIRYILFPNGEDQTFPAGQNDFLIPIESYEPKLIGTYKFDISGIKHSIDYMNTSQFLRLSVKFMPFGNIEIPDDLYYDVDEITLELWSTIYGDAALFLTIPINECATDTIRYLLGTANIALDVPLYGNTDPSKYYNRLKVQRGLEWVATIATAFGIGLGTSSAATGGTAGAALGARQSAASLRPYDLPSVETISMPSGFGIIDKEPELQVTKLLTTARNDGKYGRPTCRNIKLEYLQADYDPSSSFYGEGLVVCANSQFAPTITDGKSPTLTEQLEVQNYLDGGCYLE